MFVNMINMHLWLSDYCAKLNSNCA